MTTPASPQPSVSTSPPPAAGAPTPAPVSTPPAAPVAPAPGTAGVAQFTQPGILAKPRPYLLLAALDFGASTPADCREALERLRDLVRDEHAGDLADPVVETGELGYPTKIDAPATITVAFSSAGYDALNVPQSDRPADLVPIPSDIVPGTSTPAQPLPGEGHALLHIQADAAFVAEHVLRRVERDLDKDFTVLWSELAAQRDGHSTTRDTGRSLIGFLDGTSNLDPRKPEGLALIVVDHDKVPAYPANPADPTTGGPYAPVPGASSAFPVLRTPPSAENPHNDDGSYVAVQVNFLRTASFDHTPIADQEQIVGRHKISGVSLDLPADGHQPTDPPAFGGDPTNTDVLNRPRFSSGWVVPAAAAAGGRCDGSS